MRDLSREAILTMDDETLADLMAGYDIDQDSTAEQLADFIEQAEGLYLSLKHDILNSIENGSYTLAIEQMRDTKDRYIFPLHLINWIEEHNEVGQFDWYDLSTHDAVCQIFWTDHHQKKEYRD